MFFISSFLALTCLAFIGEACQLNAVQTCMMTMSSEISTFTDFSDVDAMCRIFGELDTCLAPYAADCAGNPVYESTKQQMASAVPSICPSLGASEDCSNGVWGYGNKQWKATCNLLPQETDGYQCTTTLSNRIPIDEHAPFPDEPEMMNVSVAEPIDSEQTMCFQKLMGCAPANPETLIPPGSLTKGFYISSRYISDYCSVSNRYTKCASRPAVLGDPYCASLLPMINAQKAALEVLCSAEGLAALEEIRPCANNQELQIEGYAMMNKFMGIAEGRSHCGYNATLTACSDAESVVRAMLDLVASKCGYNVRSTLQNLLVQVVTPLVGMMPSENFDCPDFAERIRYL